VVKTGNTILIVEDHDSIRDLMIAIFSDTDYEIFQARDGIEALKMVSKYNPDVVLLDIQLPKVNGFDVCESIKNNPVSLHTKILMISGQSQKFDLQKAREVGADGYIIKPFKPDALMEKVKELL
jgi:two-component system, OmpR family, alkaline phosphatase synthesis response regulator PhoP